MANEVQVPFQVFFDADGRPLDGGRVYIGVSGLNPMANPLPVYWDAALTIPAASVRTKQGYLVYNGAPGRLFVPADYSILVADRKGKIVYVQLIGQTANPDMFMTLPRGGMTRAARMPTVYDFNQILDSGHYIWSNAGTVNQPISMLASTMFELTVLASPDGMGTILQSVYDTTTIGPNSVVNALVRASLNGGVTWSTWSASLGTNWSTALAAALGASWSASFALAGLRKVITTSGALGTIIDTTDATYYLSAASTVTLPVSPTTGQRLTFKSKGVFTSTISANAGQTIGTTSSTSFALYAQEDYVTLEWNGTSIWSVVATNGPFLSATQNLMASLSTTGAWAPTGCNLGLSLAPGVYDVELGVTVQHGTNTSIYIAIGSGVVPISDALGGAAVALLGNVISAKPTIKNLALNATTTIQALYYNTGAGAGIPNCMYAAGLIVGKIAARRIS